VLLAVINTMNMGPLATELPSNKILHSINLSERVVHLNHTN
jgi:hypothetical protein